jgi:hypothetical protein
LKSGLIYNQLAEKAYYDFWSYQCRCRDDDEYDLGEFVKLYQSFNSFNTYNLNQHYLKLQDSLIINIMDLLSHSEINRVLESDIIIQGIKIAPLFATQEGKVRKIDSFITGFRYSFKYSI